MRFEQKMKQLSISGQWNYAYLCFFGLHFISRVYFRHFINYN